MLRSSEGRQYLILNCSAAVADPYRTSEHLKIKALRSSETSGNAYSVKQRHSRDGIYFFFFLENICVIISKFAVSKLFDVYFQQAVSIWHKKFFEFFGVCQDSSTTTHILKDSFEIYVQKHAIRNMAWKTM